MRVHDEVTKAAAMRASKLNAKIRKEARITIHAEPEFIPIRGNASASGDDAEDERIAVEIERQLDNGNEWAWCSVSVVVEWNGIRGSDHLGACSYPSQESFINDSGYYEDMLNAAIDDVAAQARIIAQEVSK